MITANTKRLGPSASSLPSGGSGERTSRQLNTIMKGQKEQPEEGKAAAVRRERWLSEVVKEAPRGAGISPDT